MATIYKLEHVKEYLEDKSYDPLNINFYVPEDRIEECYNLISNPFNRVNSPDKQYVACVTQGFEEQTTIDAIKKILSDNGYSSTENNIKVKAEEVCKIFQNSNINDKPRIPFYVLTLDKLI